VRRNTLLAALWVAFGLVWLPFAAEAQQAKLHRLGFLANHSPSNPDYQTFLQTLRELGYVEGKNITIEARYAQDNFDRLPELARELVRLDVDLLFVSGDQGVKAAKEATDSIPIVVVACDPIESMVVSIARPGGKVTGASCISSDLAGKRLQMLKELVPALAVSRRFTTGRTEQVIRVQRSARGSAQHESDVTGLQSEFTKRDRCGLCDNGKRPGTGAHDSCRFIYERSCPKTCRP